MDVGEERVTSTVRGRPVDLTIGWLADAYTLPCPTIDSAAPPNADIFSDVLQSYCPHTITEIPVGGVRLSYLPLVRSVTENFRPGTHTAEFDFGDLSLMFHLRHRIPIDVPRIMMRFIVEACVGTYAFPFPGTITRAIREAGVPTDQFISGTLRTKGLITGTSFRQSFRRIRIVGDIPLPAAPPVPLQAAPPVPPPDSLGDAASTQQGETDPLVRGIPLRLFMTRLADQQQQILSILTSMQATRQRRGLFFAPWMTGSPPSSSLLPHHHHHDDHGQQLRERRRRRMMSRSRVYAILGRLVCEF